MNAGDFISMIGPCTLPDTTLGDLRGHWVEATCAEYQEAVNAHGGTSKLSVWSGFTNMERSDRGEPFIFTCWGTPDLPVAADGGHPDERVTTAHPHCGMTHAVFIVTPTEGREAP